MQLSTINHNRAAHGLSLLSAEDYTELKEKAQRQFADHFNAEQFDHSLCTGTHYYPKPSEDPISLPEGDGFDDDDDGIDISKTLNELEAQGLVAEELTNMEANSGDPSGNDSIDAGSIDAGSIDAGGGSFGGGGADASFGPDTTEDTSNN